MHYAIRPVEEEDYGGLHRLQESVWFPVRSDAGWRWLMQDNPDQGDLEPGLIYADRESNSIGAFIGMTRLEFMKAGRRVYGGFGHTLIARPGMGGAGLRLAAGAAKRITGFAAYTLNNNEQGIQVYKSIRGRALHPQTASKSAFWVANPWLYARAGLGRRIHSALHYRFARSFGEAFTTISPLANDVETPPSVRRIDDPITSSSERNEFADRLASEEFLTSNRDHAHMQWRLSGNHPRN